jgi:hypothetical protein
MIDLFKSFLTKIVDVYSSTQYIFNVKLRLQTNSFNKQPKITYMRKLWLNQFARDISNLIRADCRINYIVEAFTALKGVKIEPHKNTR